MPCRAAPDRHAVDAFGDAAFIVSTPIVVSGEVVGAVALASKGDLVEALVRGEREQILQMFLIAILVAIGLGLLLASTIANPLADLAAAAEIGRDKNSRKVNPGRIRIPDLSGRPDEIGRLSKALRGMVAALYDRIDANEQFAADVAHEIKNPLASLRSAIGSLRFIKKDEQRDKLLDVIEHDVRRLDRLVSDISNASRLDSELVKEDEEPFDLLTHAAQPGRIPGQRGAPEGRRFHHRPAGRRDHHQRSRGPAGAGVRQPDFQRHELLRRGRRDPGLGAAARKPGAGRGRRHRPGHSRNRR